MEPPLVASISIVKEFYANAREAQDGIATVRGRPVLYTRHSINALFNLPDIKENDPDLLYSRNWDLNEVSRVLCKPRTVWATKE